MLVALPTPPKTRESMTEEKLEWKESVVLANCSKNILYLQFLKNHNSRVPHGDLEWPVQVRAQKVKIGRAHV